MAVLDCLQLGAISVAKCKHICQTVRFQFTVWRPFHSQTEMCLVNNLNILKRCFSHTCVHCSGSIRCGQMVVEHYFLVLHVVLIAFEGD